MTDHLTADIHKRLPLSKTLGIEALSLTREKAVFSLECSEELIDGFDLISSETLLALADLTGSAVASMNLPEAGVGTDTIGSENRFMGSVKGGTIVATATPVSITDSVITIETEIHQADKPVAKITQTKKVRMSPSGV